MTPQPLRRLMTWSVLMASAQASVLMWLRSEIGRKPLAFDDVPTLLLAGIVGTVYWSLIRRYTSGTTCTFPGLSRRQYKSVALVACSIGVLLPGGLIVGRSWFDASGFLDTVSVFVIGAFLFSSILGLLWLVRDEAQAGAVYWISPDDERTGRNRRSGV